MLDVIKLILGLFGDLFRSRATLEAETLALRQQIIVLRRSRTGRPVFSAADKFFLGWICRLFPNARFALAIVRPETVLRWHRAGFRSYWRWKSTCRPGRPAVSAEIRQLIREMSFANHHSGEHRGFMANCSSSGSMSGRPAWRNAWCGGGDLRRRDGRHFFAITRTASPRWTCSWFPPPRSGCSMGF